MGSPSRAPSESSPSRPSCPTATTEARIPADPPRPPTLGGRLRESGIQAAENVLRGGGDWLDRTLRIPKRPPGLAPPPDEVPAPQIIGRPSEVEPLLQRAGQRAAEVERQAAQDIEHFASQQMAEAEATEGFASAAEVAAAGAETAAAVETGGALTALGEGALAVAGAAGAATGGLVAAGARPWSARLGRSREESTLPRTCSAGAPKRAAARTATPRGPRTPQTCRL